MFILPRKLWEEQFQNVKSLVNFLGLMASFDAGPLLFKVRQSNIAFLHPAVTVIGLYFPLKSISNVLKAQLAATSGNSVCKRNIIKT